jgi:hypothetical protein
MTAAFSIFDLIAAGLGGVFAGVLLALSFASIERATRKELP